MRVFAHFLAGLVLAILLAGSAVVAIGGTVLVIVDIIEAEGDLNDLEARVRHYTDDMDKDMVIHAHPHPFIAFFGSLLASYALTFGFAWALYRVSLRSRAASSLAR